jgi:hypothetical protein
MKTLSTPSAPLLQFFNWIARGTRVLVVFSLVVILSTLFWAPAAWAVTQLRLFDLGFELCPEEIGAGAVTSGTTMPASCYLITGKAENTSGRAVIDADVFGRIFDANGNPVMQNRARVGSIETVPPGLSDFAIRISIPANQPAPLTLEKFKASGFSGKVR